MEAGILVCVPGPFSVAMADPSIPFILRYVLAFQFTCSTPQLPQAGSGEANALTLKAYALPTVRAFLGYPYTLSLK
jgi:hypothetical protein